MALNTPSYFPQTPADGNWGADTYGKGTNPGEYDAGYGNNDYN